MLQFFRRIINSRVGIVVTLGALVLIALAFGLGDVSNLRTTGMGGLSGNDVARIGGTPVTIADLRSRVQNDVDALRRQQPTMDIAQFVGGGGVEGTLERLIGTLSLKLFGEREGMRTSKRAIDGQIASIPAFQGLNGQFDPVAMRRILAENHVSEAMLREDIVRQTLAQQLTVPTQLANFVPNGVATPYAQLLLERRTGSIALVNTGAVPVGAAPTDAEVADYYRRHLARYTLPQRRVIRYALVTPDSVRAQSAPTDAELARAYAADPARFAPAQKRTIEQVVAGDQAAAAAIAAKARGGQSLADAARAAGLQSATLNDQTKAAYATASAPPVADAVFAAARGALVGPIKAPLGWIVARTAAIDDFKGKTLAQARADLVPELAKLKGQQALVAIHDAIDDRLAHNATFGDVAQQQKLDARTTPALTAAGIDPTDPAAKPDPALAPIVAGGFQLQPGDAPQLVPLGADGGVALVGVDRIVAPAPRPIAEVRASVVRDIGQERALAAARRLAGTIAAKAGAGQPLAQAVATSGTALRPPETRSTTRAELAASPSGAPAPLVLLFSMAPGTARILAAPNGTGWFVIRLDRVERGDLAAKPGVVAATRADLGRVAGRELVDQFVRAVRLDLGVKVDQAAVARVKAQLTNQGGGEQ